MFAELYPLWEGDREGKCEGKGDEGNRGNGIR
jgi:hypothetical protein